MLLTERLQFEPEVLASVWASDDRRPGYLLKSPALDSISAIVAGWMGGGGGSVIRTRRRRRRRRGVVQLGIGTDKTGTQVHTERERGWLGGWDHVNGLCICEGGRGRRTKLFWGCAEKAASQSVGLSTLRVPRFYFLFLNSNSKKKWSRLPTKLHTTNSMAVKKKHKFEKENHIELRQMASSQITEIHVQTKWFSINSQKKICQRTASESIAHTNCWCQHTQKQTLNLTLYLLFHDILRVWTTN
jgi:hypothetical protein